MKTALITGATSGIGKATAFELARAQLHLVLLARDSDRGNQLIQELKEKTGNPKIELLIADLSSQNQIQAAAKEFLQNHSPLNILINNAGVAIKQRTFSVDSIEMTFAVNHIAHFLLTNLLLDALKDGAPSRIINVSSEAHRNGQFDPDNLQGEKQYSQFRAYSNSKLCNVLFTHELARKLKDTGATVNALHPGFLNTAIFRDTGGLLKAIVRLAAKKPEVGGRAIARLALDPVLENVSGKYFNGLRMVNSSEKSHDEADAKQLWEISERLTQSESN